MSDLKTLLSPITDYRLLAGVLNLKLRHMSACIRTMNEHVRVFDMKDHRGKIRRLYAPDDSLGHIQNRVLHHLLYRHPFPDDVHGFVPDKGCVTGARPHVGKKVVINIDLKDFFPSIGANRVYGVWRKFFGANKRCAWALTRLTTFAGEEGEDVDGHLCQGFATSPALSNLVATSLDTRVRALAASQGFTYTRYADDLTFSHGKWRGEVDFMIDAVTEIAKEEGFAVNPRKTQVMRRGRRQKVLGLVVNDRVSVPRRTRRLIRSAVDHWPEQNESRRRQIRGWLSYMNQVHPDLVEKLNYRIANYEAGAASKSRWTRPLTNQGKLEC